jgi:hypothetical protein
MNDSVIKRLDHYKPIVELGPMIAATFPHEEVGRYPTEIRTSRGIENSVGLYKTHKGKLRKLIDSRKKPNFALIIRQKRLFFLFFLYRQ